MPCLTGKYHRGVGVLINVGVHQSKFAAMRRKQIGKQLHERVVVSLHFRRRALFG
jgi:hypothetical protein